ncbi:MAG: hypothetical protein Q9O62_10345 [Ardenticatenia bacterium]|nr:hypothetical protein [Ardenticatenia bacterium]
MELILSLLDQYDWVIYIVSLLGILLYLGLARRAYREYRFSVFALEREERFREARQAFIFAAFFAGIMAITFYMNMSSARSAASPRALRATPTPTPVVIGPTLTPEATPTPTRVPTRSPSPTRVPVRPSTPTPVFSPTPAPPPTPRVVPPNCPNPGVRITSPGMNQNVGGSVAVIGTANIENFQFYKVEFAAGDPPDPNAWAVIGDVVRQPVENGTLITWPASAFPPGVYWLRLTVVDVTGNFPPPCDVRVIVAGP